MSWGGWHPGSDGGTAYFARDPAAVWTEADGLLQRLEAGLAVLTAQYVITQ